MLEQRPEGGEKEIHQVGACPAEGTTKSKTLMKTTHWGFHFACLSNSKGINLLERNEDKRKRDREAKKRVRHT